MLRYEQALHAHARRIADFCMAAALIQIHLQLAFCCRAASKARRRLRQRGVRGPIKSKGRPQRPVQLRGGGVLKIKTPYIVRDRSGCSRRRRGNGRRRAMGNGALPVFEALGISQGVTPATRSEISRQAVICGGYREAEEQVNRQGLEIDGSTLVSVAVATGAKALELRDAALTKALHAPLPESSLVAGQRVRVSLDGGRARVRRTLRGRGYRPGKNGRRPFELFWREPRLITVDILDEEGESDPSWRPIYEVSMGPADEIFGLLTGLLKLIGLHKAREVVFVSDGADWIWDRVDKLIVDCGLDRERVHLALDFWHAVENLSKALKACKSMPPVERQALLEKWKVKLKEAEGLDAVLEELRELARGRRASEIKTKIAHLEKHREHMRYAELRELSLPIGSGVVESAVRRVLNLRFKSAGQCWLEEHLEALLYVRALVKSGRWESFMEAWLQDRHWLDPNGYFNGECAVTHYQIAA